MNAYDSYEVEDFIYDDFFIQWVLKATPEDDEFWLNWIAEHPDKKITIEKAKKVITSISVEPLTNGLSDIEVNSIILFLQKHAFDPANKKPERNFLKTQWLRIAAVLVVVMLGLVSYLGIKSLMDTSQSVFKANLIRVTNPTTESKLVIMPDGSLAVLKPGSEIYYPQAFQGNNRNVYLEGEAFFEVHKDPKHPFLVHSQNMTTKVLGTSFTVKAFRNAAEFKVIVNTGKVWVYNQKNPSDAMPGNVGVSLIPNEQVIFKRNVSQFKKDKLTAPAILSKEIAKKEFTFQNESLTTIISRLDKAYGVNIEYNEKTLGKKMLTASLSDHPLDEKVILICKALNLNWSFKDGDILIEEPTSGKNPDE